MMLFNKKGEQMEDQVLSVAFIFLLLIIAGGISIGIGIFYGSGYQVKQIDSDNLNYKVSNCFYNNNLTDIQTNFYTVCEMNQNVVVNSSLMVKVCKGTSVLNCVNNQTPFFFVGRHLEVNCYLSGATTNSAYPKCTSSIIVINGTNYTLITG